jgi:hypothetical protein
MVISGRAGNSLQADILTAGLNPFTCGHGYSPKTRIIQSRMELYDSATTGDTQATVFEQELFKTKEVFFPTDPYEFHQMLASTSIVFDVVQGTAHPHAASFRAFVSGDVPTLISSLRSVGEADRVQHRFIFARLVRRIQLLQCRYFAALIAGDDPDIPIYTGLLALVQDRDFHRLPHIPAEYTEAAPLETPSGISSGGGGGGNDPGSSNAGTGSARRGEVERVTNAQPTVRAWQTKYAASGKTFGQLGTPPNDSQGNQICLSYHLRGSCIRNCTRSSNHRLLVGGEKRQFQQFLDQSIGQGNLPPTGPEPSGPGNSGPSGGSPVN